MNSEKFTIGEEMSGELKRNGVSHLDFHEGIIFVIGGKKKRCTTSVAEKKVKILKCSYSTNEEHKSWECYKSHKFPPRESLKFIKI